MKRVVVDTNVLVSGLLFDGKPGKPFVTMDPSDDKFIWCAIEGRAEVIVSGDEHLLNLLPSPVPVTTVALFI
jgi:predicted nucleic acid-binding protein